MRGGKITWLDEVDSTNRYALEHFDELDDGSLVVAERQTAGRGRRGRIWLSPPGENIYASFLIKSTGIPIWHTPRISGLAVLETLRTLAPEVNFWLKWPNDLFCRDRKICGILSEVKSGQGNVVKGGVIGIGININMPESNLREIDQPATSLLVEGGEKNNLKKVAELLVIALNKYYIIGLNNSQELYALWKDENILIGTVVDMVMEDRQVVHGEIIDIGFDGELKVATSAGVKSFLSGDLSIAKSSIKQMFR
ncbi:MAG: biotin--[acetyl-CoA-carboxylase] ligase [Victivallaceae bacterium]|nr:biotin--[acetyl-CoA-carboxylase] ligase [Victivallaceae bacterium]